MITEKLIMVLTIAWMSIKCSMCLGSSASAFLISCTRLVPTLYRNCCVSLKLKCQPLPQAFQEQVHSISVSHLLHSSHQHFQQALMCILFIHLSGFLPHPLNSLSTQKPFLCNQGPCLSFLLCNQVPLEVLNEQLLNLKTNAFHS